MIDLLDRSLQRLLGSCGADVAVIWSRTGESGAGSVICTHPVGLLDPGTPWPTAAHPTPGIIHRDPAVVASLVPTSLRLELPAAPTAALSLDLADSDLVLLLIWCGSPAGAELPEEARRLIVEETADLARIVALLNHYGRTSTRLQAVVNDLKQGVVAVDHARDQVTMNPAAAALLHLEPGKGGASEFAAAMAKLEGRALNGGQVASMGQQLLADPWTQVVCTWLFAENPTHVRVTSRAIRQGAFSERIWVFDDVSGPAQALDASDAARELLRAVSDSMIDPQMLLEGVRDPAGRVVDFLYREANEAACQDMALTREELIGRTVLELLPGFAESGPMAFYAHCLETGQPGALADYSYDHEIHADSRRYDIRIAPAGKNLISLTFRDVTERFAAAQRLLEAQKLLRATVDSMLDPQVLLEAVRDPDGRVVDFRYRSVNKAACNYLGLQESDLVGHTQLEASPNLEGSELQQRYIRCVEDGEPVVLDDFSYFNEILDDPRRYDIRATRAGADLLSLTWSDVTERFLAAQRIAASEENYRLLAENSGDVIVHIRDGRIVWVSPSVEAALGAPPHYWVGRQLQETVPPEETPELAARTATVLAGGAVRQRVRVKAADGAVHWFHMHAKPFYDADGREDGALSTLRLIDDEVAAEQEAEEARRQQARAEARFRRSMDSAAIGMCLIAPDGAFVEVNGALCELFGYDADTLKRKTWQELTAPEDLQADIDNFNAVLEGRQESYRMLKQYLHADGHRIWGDLSVSCIRDENGQVENIIKQIADITDEVAAREQLAYSDEQNRLLAQRLQQQSDRIAAELHSAADYMASIMPTGLSGDVDVTSRYLPSAELGGDCFDYTWIDGDHLLVYLIDVSGHGIEPALLSVSVHNMLRSGAFTPETLRSPEAVLTELNRLFQMDHQNDHFFTLWLGVYEASTRTLRYSSAGANPAFALTSNDNSTETTELPATALPVGTFEDTVFASRVYAVPPGCQLLIFSDGANELDLADGRQLSLDGFQNLVTRVAGSSNWSLDDLIAELRTLTPTATFQDDCSLLLLTFD